MTATEYDEGPGDGGYDENSKHVCHSLIAAWPKLPPETRAKLLAARYRDTYEWRRVLNECWPIVEAVLR